MTRGKTTQTPLAPTHRHHPASDYLYLTNDAVTFLRYANTALEAALAAAPDRESSAECHKVAANCKVTFRALKEARHRTHSRYTPSGERKPAPTTKPKR